MSEVIRIHEPQEPPRGNRRYELREKLGSGGRGVVYSAWDHHLKRLVAFKRIRKDMMDGESDEEAFQEAINLATLQHPNILTIYDSGVDGEGPYIVTERLTGRDLDQAVKQDGAFDLERFQHVVHQTLEALIAAQSVGLIHRDLKPSNIMEVELPSGSRQYKILDFGLARVIHKPTPQTVKDKTIYGTIYFVAPEQIAVKPLDIRTDLYALGCIFYYLLAGRHAFTGDNYAEIIGKHLNHRVMLLSEVRPDLPVTVCDWVMWLMNPEMDDRPVSPAEALTEFNRIIGEFITQSGSIHVPGDAADEAAVRAARRWRWAAGAALVVALAAGGGLWLSRRGDGRDGPVAEYDADRVYKAEELNALKIALGRTARVRGRVTNVVMNRNKTAIYLNFSEDYKQAISLAFLVSKMNVSDRDDLFRRLSALEGRSVEAKGTVQAYRDYLHLRMEDDKDIALLKST